MFFKFNTVPQLFLPDDTEATDIIEGSDIPVHTYKKPFPICAGLTMELN